MRQTLITSIRSIKPNSITKASSISIVSKPNFKSNYSTSPNPIIAKEDAIPKSAFIALGLGTLVGVYYFFQDPPIATGQIGGPEVSTEAVERAQVAHWETKKKLQKELDAKHNAELEAEMKKCEENHPGSIERRKECEARRAAIKEKEVKLVLDRHAESFPSMGGKTRSWAEQRRAQALLDVENDKKMEALKQKLEKSDQKVLA